jgi:hypothetical protein
MENSRLENQNEDRARDWLQMCAGDRNEENQRQKKTGRQKLSWWNCACWNRSLARGSVLAPKSNGKTNMEKKSIEKNELDGIETGSRFQWGHEHQKDAWIISRFQWGHEHQKDAWIKMRNKSWAGSRPGARRKIGPRHEDRQRALLLEIQDARAGNRVCVAWPRVGKQAPGHARSGRCARADPVGGGPKMEGKNEIEDGRHALRANEAERRKSLSAEPKTNLASSPSRGTKTQLRKQRNLLATRSTRKVESQQSNENKN